MAKNKAERRRHAGRKGDPSSKHRQSTREGRYGEAREAEAQLRERQMAHRQMLIGTVHAGLDFPADAMRALGHVSYEEADAVTAFTLTHWWLFHFPLPSCH